MSAVCSKYKEMYGNIEESKYCKLISSNVYVKAQNKRVKVPQLLCIVVFVAQMANFERFCGFYGDCYIQKIIQRSML